MKISRNDLEKELKRDHVLIRWVLGLKSGCSGVLELRSSATFGEDAWWTSLEAAVTKRYGENIPCLSYDATFEDPKRMLSAEEMSVLTFEEFSSMGGVVIVVPDGSAIRAEARNLRRICNELEDPPKASQQQVLGIEDRVKALQDSVARLTFNATKQQEFNADLKQTIARQQEKIIRQDEKIIKQDEKTFKQVEKIMNLSRTIALIQFRQHKAECLKFLDQEFGANIKDAEMLTRLIMAKFGVQLKLPRDFMSRLRSRASENSAAHPTSRDCIDFLNKCDQELAQIIEMVLDLKQETGT